MVQASQEWMLCTPEGVRLQAYCSTPAHSCGRTAVVLHGWEGSADSHYILSLGARLFAAGVEVIRLNLRDHGQTHHLNREVFHSCRLPEVQQAIAQICERRPNAQRWLVGFSLGGNFMLRVAASTTEPSVAVSGVVAVSPVLHPDSAMLAMEQGWQVYQRYFVHKWRRSLKRKQALWPGLLDLDQAFGVKSLRAMTEVLVSQHTHFPTMNDYLEGYAITGERLATLQAPASILIAEDDPIIPKQDLARLAPHPQLRVTQLAHGGHLGFFERPGEASWADDFVLQTMGV